MIFLCLKIRGTYLLMKTTVYQRLAMSATHLPNWSIKILDCCTPDTSFHQWLKKLYIQIIWLFANYPWYLYDCYTLLVYSLCCVVLFWPGAFCCRCSLDDSDVNWILQQDNVNFANCKKIHLGVYNRFYLHVPMTSILNYRKEFVYLVNQITEKGPRVILLLS